MWHWIWAKRSYERSQNTEGNAFSCCAETQTRIESAQGLAYCALNRIKQRIESCCSGIDESVIDSVWWGYNLHYSSHYPSQMTFGRRVPVWGRSRLHTLCQAQLKLGPWIWNASSSSSDRAHAGTCFVQETTAAREYNRLLKSFSLSIHRCSAEAGAMTLRLTLVREPIENRTRRFQLTFFKRTQFQWNFFPDTNLWWCGPFSFRKGHKPACAWQEIGWFRGAMEKVMHSEVQAKHWHRLNRNLRRVAKRRTLDLFDLVQQVNIIPAGNQKTLAVI